MTSSTTTAVIALFAALASCSSEVEPSHADDSALLPVPAGRVVAWDRAGDTFRARAAGLGARLDARALTLDHEAASLELRTQAVVCSSGERAVIGRSARLDGDRVVLARDAQSAAFDEWWIATERGFEQGFTFRRPPCGTSGEIGVAIAVEGDLSPTGPAANGDVLLVGASGERRLRYGALHAYDARRSPLPAHMAPVDGRIVLRIDVRDAAWPVIVDPLVWVETQRLVASDATAYDDFGFAVAGSGDVGVLGAPGRDVTAQDQGAVYVFPRAGGTFAESAVVVAIDGAAGDRLGDAVAVAPGRLLAGAPDHDTGGSNAGAVYVFAGGGAAWAQEQKLVPTVVLGNARFGDAVALDAAGDVAVVGASNRDAGRTFVFRRSGTAWTEEALLLPDSGTQESFGSAVAIDGDTLIVGAATRSLPGPLPAGAAYVFVHSAGTWTKQAVLVPAEAQSMAKIGASVALSGDTAIVGAPAFVTSSGPVGSAFVFVRTGTTWTEQARLTPPSAVSFDGMGGAVAVQGDTAMMSGPGGRVAVYRRVGTSWGTPTLLTASNLAPIGRSIALWGTTAMFSVTPGPVAGSAFVFDERSGSVNGAPCGSAAECASGHCVDGVCCNTACSASCDVCAASLGATTDGQCGIAALGVAPAPPCPGGHHCSGLVSFCLTSCGSDAWCAPDHYCSAAAACTPRKANGSPCDVGAGADCLAASCRACASGSCTDGVCCDAPCAEPCATCSIAGGAVADGTCTPVAEGSPGDPDCGAFACNGASPSCPTQCVSDADCEPTRFCASSGLCEPRKALGNPCNVAAGADCAAAGCRACQVGLACADGVCCDAACSASCETCVGGTPGTCEAVAGGTPGSPPCPGGLLCDGQARACPGSCTVDGDCGGNAWCDAGACEPQKALGAACGADRECLRSGSETTGHCADGVCCNVACTDACSACRATLKQSGVNDGECGAARAGTDPHDRCPAHGAGDPCGTTGACTGAGACELEAPTVVCAAPTCVSNNLSTPRCDGLGGCSSSTTPVDCFPYYCAVDRCTNPCATRDDCQPGFRCLPNGVCAPKDDNGRPCSSGDDCKSGFCVDAVCCDSGCTRQCEACGESGSVGTCTPVAGQPRGARAPCAGVAPPCGGACDGATTDRCAYPAGGTPCGEAVCEGDSLRLAPACDGAGVCAAAGTPSACAPYGCDPATVECRSSCTGDADCSAGAVCTPDERCTLGERRCADDVTVEEPNGATEACAPYVCRGGACTRECDDSTECASGHVCDPQDAKCVAADLDADAAATDEGGCGCSVPGRAPPGGWALVALALMGTIAGLRMRRRDSGAPRRGARAATTRTTGWSRGPFSRLVPRRAWWVAALGFAVVQVASPAGAQPTEETLDVGGASHLLRFAPGVSDARTTATRQVARAAIEAYGRLFGAPGPEILIEISGARPARGEPFAQAGYRQLAAGRHGCIVTVFRTRDTAATSALRFTLAHEIAHCFQFTVRPEIRAAEGPRLAAVDPNAWWIEGSAEWLAGTVTAPTGALMARNTRRFYELAANTVFSEDYGSYWFFAFLAQARGDAAVIDLIRHVPTDRPGQLRWLEAGPGPTPRLFGDYGVALLNQRIPRQPRLTREATIRLGLASLPGDRRLTGAPLSTQPIVLGLPAPARNQGLTLTLVAESDPSYEIVLADGVRIARDRPARLCGAAVTRSLSVAVSRGHGSDDAAAIVRVAPSTCAADFTLAAIVGTWDVAPASGDAMSVRPPAAGSPPDDGKNASIEAGRQPNVLRIGHDGTITGEISGSQTTTGLRQPQPGDTFLSFVGAPVRGSIRFDGSVTRSDPPGSWAATPVTFTLAGSARGSGGRWERRAGTNDVVLTNQADMSEPLRLPHVSSIECSNLTVTNGTAQCGRITLLHGHGRRPSIDLWRRAP